MDIIKKRSGKCQPIIIDDNLKYQIKSFKNRLLEMRKYEEVPLREQLIIDSIFNDLDEYDRNILIAAQIVTSKTSLGRLLGTTHSVVYSRINKINQLLKTNVSLKLDSITGDSGISD